MRGYKRRIGCASVAALIMLAVIMILSGSSPCAYAAATAEQSLESNALKAVESPALGSEADKKLRTGEVLVELMEAEHIKFVVGRMIINEPPSAIWPVLVNPFEFQKKICARMKRVEIIQDEPQLSVMKCSIAVGFLMPDITYVVESKYTPVEQVQFRRVGGILKDFRGSWLLRARDNGASTEVLYSMFIDPGIPVPRWLIREGVKAELPRTLTGLRERVHAVSNGAALESKTIAAATSAKENAPLASRNGGI